MPEETDHDSHPAGAAVRPPEEQSWPFCRGTGLIYMVLGSIMAVATCCWPLSGCWHDRVSTDVPSRDLLAAGVLSVATPAQIWAMVAVVSSFIGGMLMAALGIALRTSRPYSGRAALALTTPLCLFFWAYLGVAIFMFPAAGRIFTALVLALLWTVSFLLAGVSADELKKQPPLRQSEQSWTSRDEDDLRRELSLRSRDRKSP